MFFGVGVVAVIAFLLVDVAIASRLVISSTNDSTWLYLGYNGSASGGQARCRKIDMQFVAASGATVVESCGNQNKFNLPWALAYSYLVNTSSSSGYIVIPQALFTQGNQRSPMFSYLTASNDPWNQIGFLVPDANSTGSMQLSTLRTTNGDLYTQIVFVFHSPAACDVFARSVDSDCTTSNSCSVASSPTFAVQSLPSSTSWPYSTVCAINNFAALSFDGAVASVFAG